MTAIVVDLDGTLNNCSPRQHLAQAQKWDEFHGSLMDDLINPDVMFLLDNIAAEIMVIGCTGRSNAFRSLTTRWLLDNRILLDQLLMRPDGDWRPDHELKPKMLEKYLGSKDKVLRSVKFVLDDRDKVVEAWREYGLPCWQVRPGGY